MNHPEEFTKTTPNHIVKWVLKECQQAPTCKKDLQKFLGKVNFLRRFIYNLSGKIDTFTPILRLKDEAKFTWRAEQKEAFDKIKSYWSSPPVLKAPRRGVSFQTLCGCGR